MTALLTILACFAGVFAFAFLVAGLAGLGSFDPPKNRRDALVFFLDHLIAAGVIRAGRELVRNWAHRADERRMVLLGIACGLACIILATLVSLVS